MAWRDLQWFLLLLGLHAGVAHAGGPVWESMDGFLSDRPEEWRLYGWNLEAALTCELASSNRDLDVLELWSGVAEIRRQARILGQRSEGFDKKSNPSQDIALRVGFDILLAQVLRLRPGGLLTVASDCSLMVLAVLRGVEVVLENPPPSWLWRLPFVNVGLSYAARHLGRAMVSQVVAKCAYQSGLAVAKRTSKHFRFVTFGDWIDGLAATCSCGVGAHAGLCKTFVQQDTGKAKNVGLVRTTGRPKELQQSGEYPPLLAATLAAINYNKVIVAQSHAVAMDVSFRERK